MANPGSKHWRIDLLPMAAAVTIAVVGIAAWFFAVFVAERNPQNGVTMISTAVADRAGATVLPTEPVLKNR